MADEEAKLLAELKYLTNLIGVHKDDRTSSVNAVRPVSSSQSAQGHCTAQMSRPSTARQVHSDRAAPKAKYSWTNPCKTPKEQVATGLVDSSVATASAVPAKPVVGSVVSNNGGKSQRVVSAVGSHHVDHSKSSRARVVKKRTVVALSKGCEKSVGAATEPSVRVNLAKTDTREVLRTGLLSSLYNQQESAELVSAIVSSLPGSPSRPAKRTVVLSPKGSPSRSRACAPSPIKRLFVGAIDCKVKREVHIPEGRIESTCTVRPLSQEAGVKHSKRTVCMPDSVSSIAGGKGGSQTGSQSAPRVQRFTPCKVSAGNKDEPMIQLNKYKIVRMSPTKVAAIAPTKRHIAPSCVSSAPSTSVCTTGAVSATSTTTVTHQSRHRLVKVHSGHGQEARRPVISHIARKPTVASPNVVKLHEHGKYRLTRNPLKARKRKDSGSFKRQVVQSKYKFVRRDSGEVDEPAVKLINTGDPAHNPDDASSYGTHLNRYTLTRNQPKTAHQNRSVLNAKRHVVLSKYKLVRRGASLTSVKWIASNGRPLRKATVGSGWVPFEGFCNASVLHSSGGQSVRKDRQRHSKSPASWKKRYSLRRSSTGCQDLSINELLGRKVHNVSKNKYKFIRGGKRHTPPTKTVASRSSLKVDHRKKQSTACTRRRRTSTGKYVVIGGDVFKSSRNKLTRQTSVRRSRSTSLGHLNKSQHKWRSPGFSPGLSVTPSSARLVASRAIYRSRLTWYAAKHRKNNSAKRVQQQYCMFYNRFGKCNRGDKCPYIHDVDKVAVCTRFLRGTCKVTDCPFSHKVAPEKMPVCRYFLRGVCHKDGCPYLHVNVNRDAQVCPDFLRGYCPLGDKCTKKHSLVCADFERTGACPRGSACKMQHPRRPTRDAAVGRRKRKLEAGAGRVSETPGPSGQSSQDSKEAEPSKPEEQPESPDDDDDINLPLKSRKLPSFIALEPSSREPPRKTKRELLDESLGTTPLQIRPRLSFDPEDDETTPR